MDHETQSVKKLILKQVHLALCTGSGRYSKHISELKKNVHVIIALIAGYVAATVGLAVTVIAAAVASFLRLATSMGVAVFCEKYSHGNNLTKAV
jgi:hypothetical protein